MILDTHVFLWWLFDDPKLSVDFHRLIADKSNDIFISSASVWEISTKFRLGKLSQASNVADNVPFWIKKAGFYSLPIMPEHAQLAGSFSFSHRDPFDRMLISQAKIEGKRLLTEDKIILQLITSI